MLSLCRVQTALLCFSVTHTGNGPSSERGVFQWSITPHPKGQGSRGQISGVLRPNRRATKLTNVCEGKIYMVPPRPSPYSEVPVSIFWTLCGAIFFDLKWQNAVTHLGGGKIFGFDHVPRLKGRGSIVPEIGGRPLTLPKQYDRATKFCTVITMEIVKFYEVHHVPIPRGGVPVTQILGPLWTAIPFELERQNTAYRDRHLGEVLRVNHVPA